MTKQCVVCGNEFNAVRSNQKYCCEACAKKGAVKISVKSHQRHKDAYNAYQRNYQRGDAAELKRTSIRNRTNYLIRKGVMQRPCVCERCGKVCKTQAHHDYHNVSEAQNTIHWLCSECHTRVHQAERAMARISDKLNALRGIKPVIKFDANNLFTYGD